MILGSNVLPGEQASAEMVWQEDFDDLNNWTLEGGSNMTGIMQTNPDHGLITVDGALTAPNSTTFDTASFAIHNSTVAYGTWRFKWYAAEGSDRAVYDNHAFIFNNPSDWNLSGETQDEFLKDTSGYSLLMISQYMPSTGVAEAPGLSLCEFTNDETSPFDVFASYGFNASITGWHNIIITRNSEGEFNVFYDSTLVMQATDNSTTTSEYFVFGSFKGDSRFDDISVSDAVDYPPATTDGYLLWLVIPTISLLIFIRKKKQL
jgi:hypothetical protein